METIFSRIEKLITNFKKAGVRGYRESTLLIKLEELELLKKEFIDLLEEEKVTEDKTDITEKFNKYYFKARTLFEQALGIEKPICQEPKLVNMANFNLETAIKVIPEFTGNYKELNTFLTIVELVNNTLAPGQKPILLTFVYNAKLTNLVRTSLGISIPTTFEELKTLLSSRYKTTKTVSHIQATLSTFSQKSMNVNTYHEKLLNLIAELNELQIKEIQNCNTTQSATIKQLNESYALNVFKNGLNTELKPTIFASRPKNLNEALQLALELEKEFSGNNEHVLYFSNYRNRKDNRRNTNNNNRYNNNYDNRGNNFNPDNNRNGNNRVNNNRYNNNNRPFNNNNGQTNNYNYNNNANRNNGRNNVVNNNNGTNRRNTNASNRTNNYNNNNRNNSQNNRRNVHIVQENYQVPGVDQGTAQTHHPEDK